MSSLGGGSSSIAGKLESSTLVDAVTIGVLLFNASVIYSMSDSYRLELMSPGSSTEALAIQLTAATVVLYGLEMLHDRVGGSRGYP